MIQMSWIDLGFCFHGMVWLDSEAFYLGLMGIVIPFVLAHLSFLSFFLYVTRYFLFSIFYMLVLLSFFSGSVIISASGSGSAYFNI